MKKIVLAAGLLLISATAHAGTYSVEGVTVHVQDGCMSARCVSVNAPGYGYYDGGPTYYGGGPVYGYGGGGYYGGHRSGVPYFNGHPNAGW